MAAPPQRLPTRPPFRGNEEDAPPPLLPPRPAGRGMRPVPNTPVTPDSDDGSDRDDYIEPANKDAASKDDQPEEVYDDFEEGNAPPPLPPHPSHCAPEEIYDDCEDAQQEIYDDCNEELPRESPGPIVQHLPKKPVRTLPPPPPPEPTPKESVYELDPDKGGPESPPASGSHDDVGLYEVGDDEVPPPLPPPLPPQQKRAEPRPPPATTTTPARPPGGPVLNIDRTQLLDLKKNLRKVSSDDTSLEKNTTSHDPKVYGECPQSVTEVKRKLEEKAEGKPGVSPKPALLPKSSAVKTLNSNSNSSSSSVTNGGSETIALKPTRPPPAVGPQSSPDVTFLPKANKDKHTNVPLPPVPIPSPQSKPVLKFERKTEEEIPPDPEEIYDDASSGDLLDKYDWFHGSIDRPKGESRVKSVGKDGTFLVRVSEKDPMFPYTLVVLHKGHVNNLRIRKRQKDGKFALGDEKSDELAFTDVPAMISHHKNHHVVLLGNNQSQVKLQHTPSKG